MMKHIVLLLSLFVITFETFGREKIDEKTKQEIINVLEINEKLFSAFFKYNSKNIEIHAIDLKHAIEKISDSKIADRLKLSKIKLLEMKEKSSRAMNNQNYHIISTSLIFLINKYDLGDRYNAFSCPMVKKKWVQNSKKMNEVHNPYDSSMPHCGKQDTHY